MPRRMAGSPSPFSAPSPDAAATNGAAEVRFRLPRTCCTFKSRPRHPLPLHRPSSAHSAASAPRRAVVILFPSYLPPHPRASPQLPRNQRPTSLAHPPGHQRRLRYLAPLLSPPRRPTRPKPLLPSSGTLLPRNPQQTPPHLHHLSQARRIPYPPTLTWVMRPH